MLDANLKTQLKAYLERVKLPFEITASLDDSAAAREMHGLLQGIVALSDKITLKTDGTDARKPSFTLARFGEPPRIRFAAIPMGHEFTSLVLALLQVGGHPPSSRPSSSSRSADHHRHRRRREGRARRLRPLDPHIAAASHRGVMRIQPAAIAARLMRQPSSV